MLTISARALIGTNAAGTARLIAVAMLSRNGVSNVGVDLPDPRGQQAVAAQREADRPIATMSTRITEVRPAIAAIPMMKAAPSRPTCLKASEIGAPSERVRRSTIAVSTKQTSRQSTVQMAKVPIGPRGMSVPGFSVSSPGWRPPRSRCGRGRPRRPRRGHP